jgi:nucleotide-binding universal stress UspA family protein
VRREATVPVVLVPPAAGDPGRSTGALGPAPLWRGLVPLDGSRAARFAVDAVRSLDRAGTIELVLVEVQVPRLLTGMSAPETLRDPLAGERRESDALGGLEAVATERRGDGRAVRARVVTDARPADAILAVASEERVDLIAMTTRGRTGVARFAIGSVADAIVRRADVPVLLVTPRDAPVR